MEHDPATATLTMTQSPGCSFKLQQKTDSDGEPVVPSGNNGGGGAPSGLSGTTLAIAVAVPAAVVVACVAGAWWWWSSLSGGSTGLGGSKRLEALPGDAGRRDRIGRAGMTGPDHGLGMDGLYATGSSNSTTRARGGGGETINPVTAVRGDPYDRSAVAGMA